MVLSLIALRLGELVSNPFDANSVEHAVARKTLGDPTKRLLAAENV